MGRDTRPRGGTSFGSGLRDTSESRFSETGGIGPVGPPPTPTPEDGGGTNPHRHSPDVPRLVVPTSCRLVTRPSHPAAPSTPLHLSVRSLGHVTWFWSVPVTRPLAVVRRSSPRPVSRAPWESGVTSWSSSRTSGDRSPQTNRCLQRRNPYPRHEKLPSLTLK